MSRKARNKELIGPYAERMAFLPVLGNPKYIDKDDEFVYYEMVIPTAYKYIDKETGKFDESSGAVLGAHCTAVDWLPVHCGIEVLEEDDEIITIKAPVPIKFLESDFALQYYEKRQLEKYACYKLEEGD